jgi:hypothetical protein
LMTTLNLSLTSALAYTAYNFFGFLEWEILIFSP